MANFFSSGKFGALLSGASNVIGSARGQFTPGISGDSDGNFSLDSVGKLLGSLGSLFGGPAGDNGQKQGVAPTPSAPPPSNAMPLLLAAGGGLLLIVLLTGRRR